MSIVKKQHYIWRNYLRSWANKESIWAYLFKSKKIIQTNLMNVAQERYFYHLKDFTIKEEKCLKQFIVLTSPKITKSLNLDFLHMYTSTSKLKATLDKTPNIDKEKYNEEIRKLEIGLMEQGHGTIENLGHKLIKCRSLDDLKTLDNKEDIFAAIMFICFQYFRTKNMRNSILNGFIGTPYEELTNKAWNIIAHVMATNLAKNISLDPKLRFIFHENNTSKHFVVGDQPVFNILKNKLDKDGNVAELELYYPITPKHALTIHFRSNQNDKYVKNQIDDDLVNTYNQKVIENSDFYLFADSEEQLKQLTRNI